MKSIPIKLRDLFNQPDSLYAKPFTRRIVLGVAFFSLLMIILAADFITENISLQVGQVSDRDVIAPRTISYVDIIKNKKLENEVLARVASAYDFDGNVTAKTEENVGGIFSAARKVIADPALTTTAQRVEKLQQLLPVSLPSAAVNGMVALDETNLNIAEEHTRNMLRKYLQRGIREDDLESTRKQLVLETESLGLSKNAEGLIIGISQTLLKPNFVLNVGETEKRKQAALASMDPVRETINKGSRVVRRGEVITPEQVNLLEELGLRQGQVNAFRIFGLAVYTLIAMAVVLGYLYKFAPRIYKNDLYLVLMGLIFLFTLLIGKIAHYYYSDFIAPMAIGALLTAILIDARVGLFLSVVLAMLYGVVVDNDLRAVSVALIGCLTGAYNVTKMHHGYSLTKTGIWIAVMNVLTIGATGLLDQINGMQIFYQSMQGIFSGIAAAVITIGLLPYLQNTFKVTTPFKLLELTNPGHPLLQRLLLDAPGTYHHSILVGNLAETAADVIGAEPITVRAGAYYHDIGKIKRPYFFVENQVEGENPHDKIAPSLSTLIVTSHIRDGVELCKDYNIPQVIVDIVQQHHGTMLVSYFYKRASENERSECIIEADFHYEGPRPQTQEAALVMLADACEAAVRSLSRPNANRIEATVRKMIRLRLQEGQLDDCNLTLKDLNTIGDVFIRVLSSMFHTRLEYPDALQDLERRKPKNGNSAKQSAEKDADHREPEKNGDSHPG